MSKYPAHPPSSGYAALKPVLIENHVYGFLCEDDKGYCKASDIRMNFMFTLATVVTNVSRVSALSDGD